MPPSVWAAPAWRRDLGVSLSRARVAPPNTCCPAAVSPVVGQQVFGCHPQTGGTMAAKVRHFRSRAEKLNAEQRAHLRQLVSSVPDLPTHAVRQITAAIDRTTAA